MKKTLQIIALLFCTLIFAQAPEKFSYQAVVRNASNAIITNAPVGVKVSILKTSAAGTVVYAETQTATTNANGLISIQIGSGTVLSGSIAGINWATDSYFIKTEIDPGGGSAYSIAGTTQLLSVPYALYSKNSGSGSGFTLPYSGTSASDNIAQFRITNTSATFKPAGLFENTNNLNSEPSLIGINSSTGLFGSGIQGLANSNNNGNVSTGIQGSVLFNGNSGAGVYGYAENAYGVYGVTESGKGVIGFSDGTGTAGYFQSGATGFALRSSGPLKHIGIGEGAGKVLTSDAQGNATWQSGTPKIHFSSAGGSNQAIVGNTIVYVNSWLGLDESGGANYNAATGEYTIPVTGYYSVKAQMSLAVSNTVAGSQAAIRIVVDGSTAKVSYSEHSVVGQFYGDTSINLEKTFTAGQKIKIGVAQGGGANNSLYALGTNFSIHLIH